MLFDLLGARGRPQYWLPGFDVDQKVVHLATIDGIFLIVTAVIPAGDIGRIRNVVWAGRIGRDQERTLATSGHGIVLAIRLLGLICPEVVDGLAIHAREESELLIERVILLDQHENVFDPASQ